MTWKKDQELPDQIKSQTGYGGGTIGLLSFPNSRWFSCRRGGMQSPCQGNDDFVAGSGLTPVLSGRKKAPHSAAACSSIPPPARISHKVKLPSDRSTLILPIHPALRHRRATSRLLSATSGLATPPFVIPPASRARLCSLCLCFLPVVRWLVRQDVVRATLPNPTPPSLFWPASGQEDGKIFGERDNSLLTRPTPLQWHFRLHQLPGGQGPQVHR